MNTKCLNIPKKIHYCWFGHNELPETAKKCIDSWIAFLPDYEIIEWNESNFDIHQCEFVKEAYKQRKWAFVSDYARIKILYENGGIYFDTDVEVIKSIYDLIEKGPFMAFENDEYVGPGLVLCAFKGMSIYRDVLNFYESISFDSSTGRCDYYVIGKIVTEILLKQGLTLEQKIQILDENLHIYPAEFFCPIDFTTGETNFTNNTRSIHHYDATWFTDKERQWHTIEEKIGNKIGNKKVKKLKNNICWRYIAFVYKYGLINAIKRFLEK